jgi:hypothetical protein
VRTRISASRLRDGNHVGRCRGGRISAPRNQPIVDKTAVFAARRNFESRTSRPRPMVSARMRVPDVRAVLQSEFVRCNNGNRDQQPRLPRITLHHAGADRKRTAAAHATASGWVRPRARTSSVIQPEAAQDDGLEDRLCKASLQKPRAGERNHSAR